RNIVTLILSRSDVLDLLSLPECIDAVEQAFRLHAEGRTLGPGVLSVPAAGGGFHIKAAGLLGERGYFAAKTNANFSENPRRWGLPTIQGNDRAGRCGERHSPRRHRVWQRDRAPNRSGHRRGREVLGPTRRAHGDDRTLRRPGRDPARRDHHRAPVTAGHAL